MNADRSQAALGEPELPSLTPAPPLAGLCALAAWAAALIHHVALPTLAGQAAHEAALRADRAGDFLVNLATIAGMIALSAGLVVLMRDGRFLGLQRRLLVALFAGILLPAVAVATFLERERTTTELVLFALGAAQVLCAMLCTSAARVSRERSARLLTLALGATALCALTSQLFELIARQSLVAWQEQARMVMTRAGEALYLLALVIAPFFVTPAADTLRDRIARGLGVATLGAAAALLYLLGSSLSRDYAVTLYHAQRVSMFVDTLPALYAVPVGAAFAAGTAAILGSERSRRQAGLGVLLWLGSGFAPRAPDKLLTAVLGSLLLLRAIAARSSTRAEVSRPVEPTPADARSATDS